MEFDNTFTVAAPIDEVWHAMLDVERVAPCVPGAQVLEQTGDHAYKVAIKVKLGPVSMVYNGGVEVVEQYPEDRRAVMRAKATEIRGQGTADARVEMRLTQENGATHGAIHTDVAISGRAAAMGQSIIADVSARLVETFAQNLAAMFAAEQPTVEEPPPPAPAPASAAAPPPPPPPPPVAPADGDSLPILSIAGGVIAQRLRNPRVLAGLAGAAVLVLAVRRRRR